MTQIYADGYATGCCLWDSVRSVGDYYIRFAYGLSRRLRRFAQMATLLDVICEILRDPWEEFFARVASWAPADCADLHRWLRYRMLSVEFCGISGRLLYSLRSWVVPQIAQVYADGYATGCYLWDSVGSVGD